jgi:diacylglycerol kinase family enzyme
VRSFLFVNPLSGSYDPRCVTWIVSRLRESGLLPELFQVTTPAEAELRCRMINDTADAPLVIIAAGDGTINAVLNGLLPGAATVAILPLGTSNVLAREIGIRSVEDGVERIVAGRTRRLPLGFLELERSSHRFLLMAGIGVDGAVVRDVRPREKRLLKQGSYGLSAIRCAFRWEREMIRVITPDRTLACHGAIVCTASRYGGDFVLAPGGDLFSPEFTVVCILGSRRRDYLRLARDLFSGRAESSRELLRLTAREVEIQGVKPVQIDGDFIGYTPARLTTIADFARLVV